MDEIINEIGDMYVFSVKIPKTITGETGLSYIKKNLKKIFPNGKTIKIPYSRLYGRLIYMIPLSEKDKIANFKTLLTLNKLIE